MRTKVRRFFRFLFRFGDEKFGGPQFMLNGAVVHRLRSVFSPAKYLKYRRSVTTAAVTTGTVEMDAVNTNHKILIVGGGPAGTYRA